MIYRKMLKKIDDFFKTHKKALLITGARQTGKTYIIRDYVKNSKKTLVEINFIENVSARNLFDNVSSANDVLFRISAIANVPLVPGKTVIFFDEVQEAKEIVTAIKFLVEEGSYQYILSGSLLGVELEDIRSVPVGYMDIFEMFPLDFEEFCIANNVSKNVLENLSECFLCKKPVDELVHQKMLELFRLYLIAGGMPEVVDSYCKTHNLQIVKNLQTGILNLYKKDISKYDKQNKLYLEEIFSLIPAELNSKNKRFILKNLNENFKFSRYEHSFIWLKDAGVALPAFCASAPELPLVLSRSTNLFKLFLSDVGLLAAMYMNGIQLKILNKEQDINFGSVYENAVAQEFRAHGFDLYYFNNKKMGELDFLIEYKNQVLPIEIKSGKNYSRHIAMDNVLSSTKFKISEGYVFCNENVKVKEKITYYPIYMIMFIKNPDLPENFIYNPDFSVLQS